MEKLGFSTQIIHTEFLKSDVHHALQMPIYGNAAFSFDTAEAMEQAFLGKSPDHSYSRISNPTVENFEQRIRSITAAQSVIATSSGMAAISNVLLTIASSGDNIITSKHLFGNTYFLFKKTLASFGIESRFCDLTNLNEIRSLVDSRTIGIFFETITNPQLEIVDITSLSELAKEHQLILIGDSTLTPPNVFHGRTFGIDIEVLSTTKIISGGGTAVGGIIIDYGTYNWNKLEKLKDEAKRYGPYAFTAKLRREVFRNLGACLSPFNAFLQNIGLETLELRFSKSVSNCKHIAAFLASHPSVEQVNYPGTVIGNEIIFRQFGDQPGALLTFELSSRAHCFHFLNNLHLIRRATNIYDNRSLIIHPASTIYCDFPGELRKSIGVSDSLIRLSPGIEEALDLIRDLKQALDNI